MISLANSTRLAYSIMNPFLSAGCMTWFVSDFDISFLCERIYIRRSVNRLNTSSEVGNRKVIQQRRGLHNAVRFQKRPVHLSSDLLRRAMADQVLA